MVQREISRPGCLSAPGAPHRGGSKMQRSRTKTTAPWRLCGPGLAMAFSELGSKVEGLGSGYCLAGKFYICGPSG